MCAHDTPCPPSGGARQHEAQVVAWHPEEGWRLLCNGLLLGDDLIETDTTFERWRWIPPTSDVVPRSSRRS